MTLMTADKKKVHTAVVVFVVVCAGALIVSGQWRSFFLGSALRPGRPAPVKITPGAGTAELYDRLEKESERFILQRDPFTVIPIISAKPVSAGISLRGIMWDPLHPMAIVNDSVVTIGDTVQGATVVDIQKDRVTVHTGENYMELRIEEGKAR